MYCAAALKFRVSFVWYFAQAFAWGFRCFSVVPSAFAVLTSGQCSLLPENPPHFGLGAVQIQYNPLDMAASINHNPYIDLQSLDARL